MLATRLSLALGIAYLGAALLGFLPAALSPPGESAPDVSMHALHGNLLGLFPVNLLHTLVHLAIGAWGILAATGRYRPVVYLRSVAVFYGLLAVLGLISQTNTLFGFVPIHGHDVWLHGLTALVAGFVGFRLPAGAESPAARTT